MSEEAMQDENAAEKLERSKSHVKNAADDLRAAAEAKVGELRGMAEAKAAEYRGIAEAKAAEYRGVAEAKAAEYKGKAEQAYGQARDRAMSFREESEQYIRENPVRAVATALGIGFIVGLIFRR